MIPEDEKETYQIYLEIKFKSGRVDVAHVDVDENGLAALQKVIYTQGLSGMDSLDLANVWIDGKLNYGYSARVKELESVNLVLLTVPEWVDKPKRLG